MTRRRWSPILAAAVLLAASCARGAEIVLEQSAVQKLIVEALFKDDGRFYAQKGVCSVYLETPSVTLNAGRVVIRSHLSGRIGKDFNGVCYGIGLASWTVVSGSPSAQGPVVRLGDIRVDDVDDSNTRLVLNSGLVPSLPGAIELDVLKAVRTMLQSASGQIQAEVQMLNISDVNAVENKLSIRFDFKLVGR
jgi:hypothetical protein